MPGYKNVGGRGFTGNGIPKRELQSRMKQHTALRDKALRKGNEADKMYSMALTQHLKKLDTLMLLIEQWTKHLLLDNQLINKQ